MNEAQPPRPPSLSRVEVLIEGRSNLSNFYPQPPALQNSSPLPPSSFWGVSLLPFSRS